MITIRTGSHSSSRREGAATCCSRAEAVSFSDSITLMIHRFGQRVLAALAQAGRRWIARYGRHVAPAPFALHPAGTRDRHAWLGVIIGWRRAELDLGDNEQHRQIARVLLEQRQHGWASRQYHLRLQGTADLLGRSQRLDLGHDLLPDP